MKLKVLLDSCHGLRPAKDLSFALAAFRGQRCRERKP
jgi:hypothetical protein